jgi:hypothetical protein
MKPMNPLGKISFARRLSLAVGLAFACVALPAMAQTADDYVGLYLLNQSLGLPVLTSKGAVSKPLLTFQTASAAQDGTIVQDTTSASGTFYVLGGVVTTASAVGSSVVVLPAPNNVGADIGGILSYLDNNPGKTTVDKVAVGILDGAYAGLKASTGSENPNDYADATAAAANNNYYLNAGITQAKADADEQAVLAKYAFGTSSGAAVAGVTNNPIPVITEAIAVSDSSAASEAVLVSTVLGTADFIGSSGTLYSLGQAIQTSDSSVIASSTSTAVTNGGATFLEKLFTESSATKLGGTSQQAFVEGFTSGESASQLAASAGAVSFLSAGAVGSGGKADAATQLEDIAAGLILSGSLASDVTSTTVIGVTEGITNTTAQATPKAIAALDTALIVLLPADAFYIAPASAQVGGTGNALVVADILTAKTIVGTPALVQAVAQGAASNPIAYPSSTQDQFLTSLAFSLSNQKVLVPQIATDLYNYDSLTGPELSGDLSLGAPKLDVAISGTLTQLDYAQSASIAYASAKAVAGTAGANDKLIIPIAEAVIGLDGSNGFAAQAIATSGSLGLLTAPGLSVAVKGDKVLLTTAILTKSGSGIQPFATQVALAIGDTVTDVAASLPTDLTNIAGAASSAQPSSAVTTATSVEELALGQGTDPVITGTAFGSTFIGLKNNTAVVAIASTAAASTSGLAAGNTSPNSILESGSVGASIDSLKSVYASIALTGSVASAVAQASTFYVVPGSFEQAVDNNNYQYYTVASVFGQAGFAIAGTKASGLGADYGLTVKGNGVGYALGLGVENASGNQAAAAIAYDLAIQAIQANATGGNSALVSQIAQAVATAQPGAVADIFGYIAQAVTDAWGTAAADKFLWGSGKTNSASSPAANTLVAILEGIPGTSGFKSDIVTAAGDIVAAVSDPGLFQLNGAAVVSYVTADETPVVNF